MLVGCPWGQLLPIVIKGESNGEKEINQLVGESTEKKGVGTGASGPYVDNCSAEKETHEQKRNKGRENHPRKC